MVLPLIENNIVKQNINGGIKITDYDIACGTNVTIPNMINNKIVKTIGTSAFENKGITSVKLGEGLETIEKYAFFNNPITSINIPNSLNEIEDDTFYELELSNTSEEYQKIMAINNNAITTPTDENCFTYQDVEGGIEITDYSSSCSREVVIPSEIDNKSVVSIGKSAFAHTTVSGEVAMVNNPNVKFMSNDIELAAVPEGNIEKVIIPETVTYIGGWAFLYNQISSVKFGNNVEYIGRDAFYGNLLTEVELPASLTNIGNYAFSGNDLTSVIFVGRSNLDGVTLGDSVWGWADGYSDDNIGFRN